MQDWQYGKGLICLRPIFRLTKLALLRAGATLPLRVRICGQIGGKCDPVPRKFVTFNPELNQILSKVFLPKNRQLDLTKYCRAFTPRYSNDNTKC